MSRGILSWGDFVLGGILSRGILSGGFCPGGFCPGGFCPDTSCSSWQRLGVSACAQFDIFVIKVGSTCENKTDLDEKRIFHYKLSKKLSEAPRNISIFKIPLYNTNSWTGIECLCLCPFVNFYPHGLKFKKLCILSPITCHRLTLKGKLFCITGKSLRKS